MNTEQLAYPKKQKRVRKETSEIDNNSKPSVLYLVPSDSEILPKDRLTVRPGQVNKVRPKLQTSKRKNPIPLSGVTPENTRLLSIIAHDLRSPFCSILLALEFINEKLDHSTIADIKEYVKIASAAAKSSLELLNELFSWAVSQSKEKSLNCEKINLFEIINAKIEYLNISARQKQINLKYNISSTMNVNADLQMVKTILRNLISNAIKNSKSGSEILVSAIKTGRFAEITVKDNGSGMSITDQRNLFVNDNLKSFEGSNYICGLGLHLCKEFVELHGGTIKVCSELGSGSEIKFTLPLFDEQYNSSDLQYILPL